MRGSKARVAPRRSRHLDLLRLRIPQSNSPLSTPVNPGCSAVSLSFVLCISNIARLTNLRV